MRVTMRTRRDGPVLVVTIDRPEVRNAVDRVTADALVGAFRDFDQDDAVAVAVLTGAGGAFCYGADLEAVAAGDGNRLDETGDGPMGPTRMTLSKPVIAAIEGHAVADGLELALWCDLRVAAEDAVLGVFSRRWGVPLIDGGTVRLGRIIGHGRALEMILTGRPVSAAEALRIGLVTQVTAPGTALDTAVALARSIAAFPQGSLRADRGSAHEQWGTPMDAALVREAHLGGRAIASGETVAGAARFAAGAGRHGAFDSDAGEP